MLVVVLLFGMALSNQQASKPIGVTVIHGVGTTWNASTSSGVTYSVYRGTKTGGPYTKIASGLSTTAYQDKNVVGGTTYFYVTTAVDAQSHESSFSNETSVTIQ